MVTIKNGKYDLELKFGLGELNAIDRALGYEVREINLGEGLETLLPKLQSGNVLAIAKIIKACTRGQKGHPRKEEELEHILTGVVETYGSFQAFGKVLIEELGNKPLTQDLVKMK
ncbi:TPA: phage tail protein [Staphylococcus aureus]|nr:phage tail protein [Staphylococcus aureus]